MVLIFLQKKYSQFIKFDVVQNRLQTPDFLFLFPSQSSIYNPQSTILNPKSTIPKFLLQKLLHQSLRFFKSLIKIIINDHFVETKGVSKFVFGFSDAGFE